MRSRTLSGFVAALALTALTGLPEVALAHDGDTEPRPVLHGHTAKLDDLRAATADMRSRPADPWGVRVSDLAGISCIVGPNSTGAMGIHYLDPDNFVDGSIDRLAPEALIYEPGGGGSLTLVAAEYLVLAADWDATHTAPPILYGQRFSRVAAGNRYGLPDFYELHVWHERANPSGIFNDWNPTVSCS